MIVGFVRTLDEVDGNQIAVAGGKGASLGELVHAGAPVPPAFIVTSAAFEAFMRSADPEGEVSRIVQQVDAGALEPAAASERVFSLLGRCAPTPDVASAIREAVDALGSRRLCVRSSATCEDSGSSAWAGQLDTYLAVEPAEVLEKVRACWLSIFGESPLAYGAAHGYGAGSFAVAVVVQEMVPSEIAGIGFSVHPVTQEPDVMLIEACLGLGEAIVSGQIAPDRYVVEKGKREIAEHRVGRQKKGLFARDGGEPAWRALREDGARAKLTDAQALEYAELLARIEDHYGFPVDTEWAHADGEFKLLQARPITTLAPEYREPVIDAGVDWQPLIRRPMSLLEISTWSHWVDAEHANKALDTASDKVAAIQDASDIATLLLEASFGARVTTHIEALYREDRAKLVELLEHGREVYHATGARIERGVRPTLDESCELFIEALQFTGAIPFLTLGAELGDEEITRIAENLRAETLYPVVEREFVVPAAVDRVRELGFSAPEQAAQVATWRELREGRLDRDTLEARWAAVQRGQRFVFQLLPGGEHVRFVSQTGYLLMRAAHQRELATPTSNEIQGQAAWPGVHRGRARVVLTPDAVGQTIEDGEVLISIQSSPALMPLLTQAGGIVTDEGGVACHAAIICRELKIPTLIGTDTATQTIRTGDLVEVDAYAQVVRILERA
jgi:phosphohistidine swiveling domain-containing protein